MYINVEHELMSKQGIVMSYDHNEMRKLATSRKSLLRCLQSKGCLSASVKDPAEYTSVARDWVSPITHHANNGSLGIMIVLNNWATVEETIAWNEDQKSEVYRHGFIKKKRTNSMLDQQLCKNDLKRSDVYITNAFPYIAPMKPAVTAACLREVYSAVLLREIRIVKPKLIICCGVPALSAIRYLKPMIGVDVKDPEGVKHPAAFISNDERDKEWRRVLKGYHGLRHK